MEAFHRPSVPTGSGQSNHRTYELPRASGADSSTEAGPGHIKPPGKPTHQRKLSVQSGELSCGIAARVPGGPPTPFPLADPDRSEPDTAAAAAAITATATAAAPSGAASASTAAVSAAAASAAAVSVAMYARRTCSGLFLIEDIEGR
jgi:hypothetical protein